jgi:seryl-tRNA synthetase
MPLNPSTFFTGIKYSLYKYLIVCEKRWKRKKNRKLFLMDALEKLLELDNRHNELLEELEQLDTRINKLLKEWTGTNSQQDFHEKFFPLNHSKIKAA